MEMYDNTEIRELILRCRNRDDDAFDLLVHRYTPMMRKVISGFDSAVYGEDELFSEACVALHTAAQRYDMDQDQVSFGLFARICVRNRIVDLYRARHDSQMDERDVELMGYTDSVEDRLADRELFYDILGSAKNLLSEYEYRVLLLHIQGYKTSAIAERLGKSAKSVDNAKSRLFRRLREELRDISII